MAIKSRVVLPYLVPQLIAPPRVNTKALSILASVAGEALTKYLHKILPALLAALSAAQGTPQEAQVSVSYIIKTSYKTMFLILGHIRTCIVFRL